MILETAIAIAGGVVMGHLFAEAMNREERMERLMSDFYGGEQQHVRKPKKMAGKGRGKSKVVSLSDFGRSRRINRSRNAD